MSALKGTNVKAVHNWMVANIPEGPTLYPKEQVAEQPEKFFVTEIIREQVFRMYDHEVPYSVTVRSTSPTRLQLQITRVYDLLTLLR